MHNERARSPPHLRLLHLRSLPVRMVRFSSISTRNHRAAPVCCQSSDGGWSPSLQPPRSFCGDTIHLSPATEHSFEARRNCALSSALVTQSPSCKRRKGGFRLTREHGTSNRRLQRVREMDAESGIRLGTSARGKLKSRQFIECLDDQRELTTLRFTIGRRRTMHGVIHATVNDVLSNSIPTQ